MSAFLLAAFLVMSADAADTPGTGTADVYQYHARVVFPEEVTSGFVRLTLPGEVVDKLQPSWGDLRLVDDQGRTVPYLLRRDTEPYGPESAGKAGVCQGVTVLEGGSKAFLVDFNGAVRKNRIDLRDWMRAPWPLRIEGSADKEEWHNLLDPDYRVQERMDQSGPLSHWLQLEPGDHRWLRVVYAAGKAPAANTFTAPMLADYLPAPEEAGLVPISLTDVEPVDPPTTPHPGVSVYEWKVACQNMPVMFARFGAGDPYFSRRYTLEGSYDGKYWTGILSGTLNRTQWEKHAVDALDTMGKFVTESRLRLTINDGDNPPLSIHPPELWGRTGQLCFDISGRKEVALYAGNVRASAPNYDIAQSVRDLRVSTFPIADLGALEKRPADVPGPVEKPDETKKYFLWAALVLAACVMLGIVVNSMAAMNRADRETGPKDGLHGEDT